MSSVYEPCPRTRTGSSLRGTGCPMPNFITARACGSFCRFIKECLDQQIACKPVGRRRQLHGIIGLPALSRSAARFEIKDARALDKDVEPRHARNAHLLREPPACYSWFDLGSNKAAAVEPGRLRRGRKEFMKDEGRAAGGLDPVRDRVPQRSRWGRRSPYGHPRHEGAQGGDGRS